VVEKGLLRLRAGQKVTIQNVTIQNEASQEDGEQPAGASE